MSDRLRSLEAVVLATSRSATKHVSTCPNIRGGLSYAKYEVSSNRSAGTCMYTAHVEKVTQQATAATEVWDHHPLTAICRIILTNDHSQVTDRLCSESQYVYIKFPIYCIYRVAMYYQRVLAHSLFRVDQPLTISLI